MSKYDCKFIECHDDIGAIYIRVDKIVAVYTHDNDSRATIVDTDDHDNSYGVRESVNDVMDMINGITNSTSMTIKCPIDKKGRIKGEY